MILRKPYAFLIKNFKKINILLLALVGFVLWKDLSLYGFIKDYASTGIYNTMLDSIQNYINIFEYLSFILIFLICGILAYLLKYKNKPYFMYIFILILDIITFILFIYAKYYFTITVTGEFKLASVLVVRDLIFISTLPYYPILFLLTIRSIGLDLKKFGFGEDKEFIQIGEEDREEVEVAVSFDKDKFVRQVKNKIRLAKYFFLEHKLSLSIIFGIILLIGVFNLYTYTFVQNKVYKLGQTFTKNGYDITINNTYITDRDYTGNTINDNMTYMIVEATIKNNINSKRIFDPSKMYLYVDNYYYLPSDRFNNYFVDMGTLYTKDRKIAANSSMKLLFIYEIKKPNDNSNFLLTYQTTNIHKRATRISIRVVDISRFITKGTSKLDSDITVPINENKEWKFSISNYQITDSLTYRYGECNTSGTCPIYENTVNSPSGKTILTFRFDTDSDTKNNFLAFLKKYGKVRYTVNGEEKEEKVRYAVSTYRGNYGYLVVSSDIKNATSISLVFTVRSYQYFYNIKG